MKFTKLLLAAFTAFTLVGCSKTEKVDITPYIDIAVEGMNGEGVATVAFDSENFANAVAAVSDVKTDADRESAKQAALTAVTFSLDKQETLSNGDTVKVSATLNNDLLKPYKVELTATDKEFEVADLRDKTVISPFDPTVFNVSDDTRGIHIKVVGADPLMKVIISNDCSDGMDQSKILYSFDPENAYSNASGEHKLDDELTIYAIPDSYRLPEAEYSFDNLSTTFKITNGPRYVQSLDDLSEEQMLSLQDLLNEKFDLAMKKGIYITESIIGMGNYEITDYGNLTPMGVYFVSSKKGYAPPENLFSKLGILYKLDDVTLTFFSSVTDHIDTAYVFSMISSPVLSDDTGIYGYRSRGSLNDAVLQSVDLDAVAISKGYLDQDAIIKDWQLNFDYPDLSYIELQEASQN